MNPIQRQYNLPNCTLILDGFNDRPKAGNESRPLMTMLMNVECRLTGHSQALQGGREFLESLVRATSLYAQEVLSGIQASQLHSHEQVQLQSVGLNLHRLSLKNPTEPAASTPQELTLSSVQLFDLIEAIDQMLSDPQTLPDLAFTLTPISKRYIQSRHPAVQQVVPATVGVTSLAAAAIALSLLPIPVIQRPSDTLTKSSKSEVSRTPLPTPSPTLSTEITEPAQLNQIQTQLFSNIDSRWTSGVPSAPIAYRVTADQQGRVIGYLPQGDIAREELDKTPLIDLLKLAKAGGSLSPKATAQFLVTFNPNGTIDLKPWSRSGTPTTNTPAPNAVIPLTATPAASPTATAPPEALPSSAATPEPSSSPALSNTSSTTPGSTGTTQYSPDASPSP